MLTIQEIINAVGGNCCRSGTAKKVSRVVIDSRQVKKGALFFAIKGLRLDGHAFIKKAAQAQAAAIVVSNDGPYPSGVWVIRVKDTTLALGDLARYYRGKFRIPVVAITGSAGKTTTKEMIAGVLRRRFKVLKNNKTENNQYGVPMTLLRLRPHHDVVVVELGTNHFGEMKYLARISQPTIAVMTNIGASHLEFLKTPAGVFKEKFDIVRYTHPSGYIVINGDDPYLRNIKSKDIPQQKIVYGVKGGADVRGSVGAGSFPKAIFFVGKQKFILNAVATHNIYNALAAIAVGRVLKINSAEIAEGLARWRPVVGRQCFIKTPSLTIMDDTYNANPVSFKSALVTFAGLKTQGRKILVCGDMKELGRNAVTWHEDVGSVAAVSGVDVIVSVGENARHIAETAQRKNPKISVRYCQKIDDINSFLKYLIRRGDMVLVKGSRSMNMDQVVRFLTAFAFIHGHSRG